MRKPGVAWVCVFALSAAARADVTLSASRVDASTVALSWTAGSPYYQVYRAAAPSGVASPSNLIAFTGLTGYTDGAASGSLLYYLVTDGHCATAAECPAGECTDAVCNSGDCGVIDKAAGYVLTSQVAGDCQTRVCDGSGGVTQQQDDTDVPVDGNGCTLDVCTAGVPSNPPRADGTACTDGDGSVCQSGVCVPTVAVLRVGDGVTALSTAAAALTIDRFSIDGSALASIALPTSFSASNQPCTLGGSTTSEGSLTRSTSGASLVVAAYGASPGVSNVSTSASASVNRVVCRVDSGGAIDSSTSFASAFNAASVRGATTTTGGTYWVSGTSSSALGGVWVINNGSHSGTQILPTPNSTRWVGIAGGQLYGDAASGAFDSVFTIGSGLPTMAGQTATTLPGLPTTAGPSPYGFVFFDVNPNVAGFDLLYIADDRATASGGGIQKWTFDGTTWSLAATLSSGLSTGVRGLAGYRQANGSISLFATTTESSGNKLVRFVDDLTIPPGAATQLAIAPTNTAWRGVALGMH